MKKIILLLGFVVIMLVGFVFATNEPYQNNNVPMVNELSGGQTDSQYNYYCGDGVLNSGEQCDDGNTVSGDGCSSTCIIENIQPVCGNDIKERGEECDDGNRNGDRCDNDRRSCDYCSRSCKIISLEEKDNNRVKEKRSIFLYNDNFGTYCNSNWICTGWTDCDGGVITRNCRDANNCVYPLNKPMEVMSCDSSYNENDNYVSTTTQEKSNNGLYYSIPFALLVLIAVLFLFILVFVVNWKSLSRR